MSSKRQLLKCNDSIYLVVKLKANIYLNMFMSMVFLLKEKFADDSKV